MTLPPWADRRKRQDSEMEGLFATGPAGDWATPTTQPISALVRPSEPDDDHSPTTEVQSVENLDAIAKSFER